MLKKIVYFFIMALFSLEASSQIICNPGGVLGGCSGDFYDTGCAVGNYGNNQNITTSLCNNAAGFCVTAIFTVFNLAAGDVLNIYDGFTTADPLIGSYTGVGSPGTVSASATNGCLTFEFISNGAGTSSGWAASLSCAACAPLPIKLISFDARCDNNRGILNWSVASQTNNDYFTVERSTDGISWETIGTVDGAGNSSTTLNYEFIDSSLLPFGEGKPVLSEAEVGVGLYRLRQTDFDGKFEYFDPVAVEACSSFAVFPNPAENEFNIQLFSETEDEITLEVYDLLGELILSRVLDIAKGSNLLTLDISSAAGGMYLLKVKTSKGDLDNHQKFIKRNNKRD